MALEGRYSEKKVISLLEESVTANDAKRQEIIEALSKPKIGGTKTEKRNLLGSILDNQTIIASTIRSLNQNQLAKEFEVICAGRTSRTIANDRKYPAEKLAELYMDIGSIYDRFEKLSSSLKTDTRNILIIDNLLKVYRIAQQEVVHGRQENLKSYLHKLSPAEQARGYLVDGSIPADPALRSCPICGHDKVDEPDTNIQNWFTNVERQQKYQVKLAWHEAYKVRADYEGRAPPPPILKPIYIRCGCKRIQCNGPGQTNCSFCQTMGDKRDTDSKGNCIGCAVCGCECLFACKVSIIFKSILHYWLILSYMKCFVCSTSAESQGPDDWHCSWS